MNNPYTTIALRGDKPNLIQLVELTTEEMDAILDSLLHQVYEWGRTVERCLKEENPRNFKVSDATEKARAIKEKYKNVYMKLAEFMEIEV